MYRQIVGYPMGTNYNPFVADLFLFCYERDFMLSLSDNNQADATEAFNSSSRYLDDLLIIVNPYFEQMLGQLYPAKPQLNNDDSLIFFDFSFTVKAAPHECVIRTGQP